MDEVYDAVTSLLTGTPAKDGFAMPAERGPHSGCYMVWPERPDVWRGGGRYAQAAFAALASGIAEFEPLTMLASPAQAQNARKALPCSVRVIEAENDDAWARDTSPAFVTTGSVLRGVDWEFNAWAGESGPLYADFRADDALAAKICAIENIDRYRTCGFVFEGGAVHVDGEGTGLVTRPCLLSPGRNPCFNEAKITSILKDYLGLEKIIWLPEGLLYDETGGHVDNIACFVKPGLVALAWTEDKKDPRHKNCALCREALLSETDLSGRPIQVVTVPLPPPLYMTAEEADGLERVHGAKPRNAGDPLAGSYINYYTGNGAVFVPGFGAETDASAVSVIQSLYPERKVVQMNTREILLGGGNIHCVTAQVPLAGKYMEGYYA